MKTKAENLSFSLPLLVSFLIFIFAFIAAVQLPIIRDAYRNSDFFTYWLAGRDIAQGINPYDSPRWISDHYKYGATWVSDPKLIYPLPLGILFVPLGLLPLEYASSIWIFLTIISIFFSLFLISKNFSNTSNPFTFHPRILTFLVGLFFFRPFVTVIYWGQLGGLILLIITGVTYCFKHNKWFLGGLLSPILIYKPQIGLPVVGFVVVWLLAKRIWSAISGIIITVLLTFAVSYAINPNWIQEWLSVGSDKVITTSSRSVTIWGLSSIACGFSETCSYLISFTLTAVLLIGGVTLLVLRKNETTEVIMGLVICLSLLITPYLLVNDLILLLFPMIILVTANSKIFNTILFLIVSSLFILFVPLNDYFGSEGINAIVTIIVLICYSHFFISRYKQLEFPFRVFHRK